MGRSNTARRTVIIRDDLPLPLSHTAEGVACEQPQRISFHNSDWLGQSVPVRGNPLNDCKSRMLSLLLLLLLVLALVQHSVSLKDAKIAKSQSGVRRLLSSTPIMAANIAGDGREDIGPNPSRVQLQCIYCGG